MTSDRNFDDLAERFQRNVYGGSKGAIRLAVLGRDIDRAINTLLPGGTLRILDVGAGLGQIGIDLALRGHEVTLSDLSEEMLRRAKMAADNAGVSGDIQWRVGPYQTLLINKEMAASFDLVICHALIEWLADPGQLIEDLKHFCRPDGVLSLTCYNRHALTFRNLIKGNFDYLREDDLVGDKGSLTPMAPQDPLRLKTQLEDAGWQVDFVTGVRVIHDYGQPRGGNLIESELLDMELRYSTEEPFKWLGRYVHFVCRRRR